MRHLQRPARPAAAAMMGARASRGPGPRLRVDAIARDGRGLCAEMLPELITLDDWGFPIISADPGARSPDRRHPAGSSGPARCWRSGSNLRLAAQPGTRASTGRADDAGSRPCCDRASRAERPVTGWHWTLASTQPPAEAYQHGHLVASPWHAVLDADQRPSGCHSGRHRSGPASQRGPGPGRVSGSGLRARPGQCRGQRSHRPAMRASSPAARRGNRRGGDPRARRRASCGRREGGLVRDERGRRLGVLG